MRRKEQISRVGSLLQIPEKGARFREDKSFLRGGNSKNAMDASCFQSSWDDQTVGCNRIYDDLDMIDGMFEKMGMGDNDFRCDNSRPARRPTVTPANIKTIDEKDCPDVVVRAVHEISSEEEN